MVFLFYWTGGGILVEASLFVLEPKDTSQNEAVAGEVGGRYCVFGIEELPLITILAVS